MDKLSISDFCENEKTYAQLIQDLYFHISVKKLFEVLESNAAQNGDAFGSVFYRNTYSSLEDRIPDDMTVGELLRHATYKCLLKGTDRTGISEYSTDRRSIELGYKIIKALLVDLFRPPYAPQSNQYNKNKGGID